MKSKQYVEQHIEVASSSLQALISDVDGNRPYANREYVLDRLEYIKKMITLVQDRLVLEDENS